MSLTPCGFQVWCHGGRTAAAFKIEVLTNGSGNGEFYWLSYPDPFLKHYYNSNPQPGQLSQADQVQARAAELQIKFNQTMLTGALPLGLIQRTLLLLIMRVAMTLSPPRGLLFTNTCPPTPSPRIVLPLALCLAKSSASTRALS